MKAKGCPRARTFMTPCVERDGDPARDDDGACVGCGFYPPVQLTIDGREVPHPLPAARHMTARQRDLWLFIAMAPSGYVTTGRARHFYADASGALRRLERFGRVERVGRGRWAAR
jgi:hypothetical protein